MWLLSIICGGFQQTRHTPTNCISLPPKIIKRPDPATYDQLLELAQGRQPAWDNPDMLTHEFPGFTPLEELSTTVRNLSPDASAFHTQIEFSWSTFGIGVPRSVIGAVPVDLNRAGFAGDVQTVKIPTSPAMKTARRFNLFATVRHPYDVDPTNNEGEQAFDSQRTSEVGRSMTFRFPVRNSLTVTASVSLQIAPAKWGVNVTPSSFVLNPAQTKDVQVSLTVPSSVAIGTREAFSVYATTPQGLLGGVALMVNVD